MRFTCFKISWFTRLFPNWPCPSRTSLPNNNQAEEVREIPAACSGMPKADSADARLRRKEKVASNRIIYRASGIGCLVVFAGFAAAAAAVKQVDCASGKKLTDALEKAEPGDT